MDPELEQGEGRSGFRFGASERQIGAEAGMTLHLAGGLQQPSWDHTTLFFDLRTVSDKVAAEETSFTSVIATEAKLYHAPLEIVLKVNDKAPPGSHSLQFFLTYFNGNEWKIDSQTVSIFV